MIKGYSIWTYAITADKFLKLYKMEEWKEVKQKNFKGIISIPSSLSASVRLSLQAKGNVCFVCGIAGML